METAGAVDRIDQSAQMIRHISALSIGSLAQLSSGPLMLNRCARTASPIWLELRNSTSSQRGVF
jgi:hypothetical protein